MFLFPTENTSDKRLAFGVDELAHRLNVSPSFIRLEIKRKRLGAVRLGRRSLITVAEIERYLADNSEQGV
jgi:excisionase family DNA binding protein